MNNIIRYLLHYQVHTPILGLGRSILAFSLMLTLMFNDPNRLFNSGLGANFDGSLVFLQDTNFFHLLADHIVLAKWIAITLLAIIISGYLPQVTCLIQWYLSFSYLNSSLDIEGGDQIMTNLSLLLIPICLTERRWNHWRKPIVTLPQTNAGYIRNLIASSWFLLIKVQVMIIYFHSAVGKFVVPEWTNGTALYYWFNHPVFGMQSFVRPLVSPIVTNHYLAFYLCWFVMMIELVFSISILFPAKYKKSLFYTAVGFHFMIILLHGLFSFFITMCGALTLYYLADYFNHKREEKSPA